MATFAPVTPQVTPTTAATFIPEIWSDETIAEYESNLVLAGLIKRMSMKGKKGDTIHVPSPIRGDASQKASETAVTLIAEVEGELVINIDQHWEYSRMIEDITSVQALGSLRRFYTSDAGYALAKTTDNVLFQRGKQLGDDNGSGTDWIHSNSIMTNASGSVVPYALDSVADDFQFTDVTMRAALQKLDDADVPMSERFLIVPPSLCNTMRGIERYISSDFRDNRVVASGAIGTIYDVPVYVSTNVPVVETAAENPAGGDVRGALLAHRDVYVLAEQVGVRSQTQYKQEFLATLYTADRLFGTQCYRPEAGVNIMVPNAVG